MLIEQFGDKLKIITYPPTDYPGYSYIKIYNKNSSRENLLRYICRENGIEKNVTLLKDNRSINKIARELKNSTNLLCFQGFCGRGRELWGKIPINNSLKNDSFINTRSEAHKNPMK